jgi:hypothetical protein
MSSCRILINNQCQIHTELNSKGDPESTFVTFADNIHQYITNVAFNVIGRNMSSTNPSAAEPTIASMVKITITPSLKEIVQYRHVDKTTWLIVDKIIGNAVSNSISDIVKDPILRYTTASFVLLYGWKLTKTGHYHDGFTVNSLLTTTCNRLLVFDIWNIKVGNVTQVEGFKYLVCKCAADILGQNLNDFIIYNDNTINLEEVSKKVYAILVDLRTKKQESSKPSADTTMEECNASVPSKEEQ